MFNSISFNDLEDVGDNKVKKEEVLSYWTEVWL